MQYNFYSICSYLPQHRCLFPSRYMWLRTTWTTYWNRLREGPSSTYLPSINSPVDAAYDIPAKGVACVFTGNVRSDRLKGLTQASQHNRARFETERCFKEPLDLNYGPGSKLSHFMQETHEAHWHLAVLVVCFHRVPNAVKVLFVSGPKYWVVRQLKMKSHFGSIYDYGFPARVRNIDTAVHISEYGKTFFFIGHDYYR